jgi:D-sedoheptulose 7-phosphate isomerase
MNLDQYITASIANLDLLKNKTINESFVKAVEIFSDTIHSGGNILVCGNGGSHSDSMHFAAELVNYFTIKHRALPVIALGTNGSVATAWSNDHAFEDQFAREVEAYGNSNSILFGITTSGKSKNVNNAFNYAHSIGMRTIALTSERAIPFLPSTLDNLIAVPVLETHKIQECHLVIYHALCIAIEQSIKQ